MRPRAARPRGSFGLAELLAEEFLERRRGVAFVGPFDLELDHRADARGEHHHPHDALRVHAPSVALDPDAALEFRGELRELRRGARVQPELVADADRALDHRHSPGTPMRVTPSVAPEIAFSSTAASGSLR